MVSQTEKKRETIANGAGNPDNSKKTVANDQERRTQFLLEPRVYKRNDVIQRSRFNLTRTQNNIFSYLISLIGPNDDPDKEYIVFLKHMAAALNYKSDIYSYMKKQIQELNSKSFWIDADNPDDDDQLITIFDSDSIKANRRGYFKFKFSKKIRPYIMELNKQYTDNRTPYTGFFMRSQVLMKHYCSQRLYELFKSYETKKDHKWTFEYMTGSSYDIIYRIAPVDLSTKKSIIPKTWEKWHLFERDVLKVAMKDIEQYGDIKFMYVTSKRDLSGNLHKNVASITFAIVRKTRSEMEETMNNIQEAYGDRYDTLMEWDKLQKNHNDKEENKQITLDDYIKDQLQKQKEEDERDGYLVDDNVVHETDGKEVVEEHPNQKKTEETYHYPQNMDLYTVTFQNDFSNKEMYFLYKTALRHVASNIVTDIDMDMWMYEYVTYYWDMVQATASDTKTTPFKRLLDNVNRDYKNYAAELNTKYAEIAAGKRAYL